MVSHLIYKSKIMKVRTESYKEHCMKHAFDLFSVLLSLFLITVSINLHNLVLC